MDAVEDLELVPTDDVHEKDPDSTHELLLGEEQHGASEEPEAASNQQIAADGEPDARQEPPASTKRSREHEADLGHTDPAPSRSKQPKLG